MGTNYPIILLAFSFLFAREDIFIEQEGNPKNILVHLIPNIFLITNLERIEAVMFH